MSRTSRTVTRRKKSIAKWREAGQRTLLFSLFATLAVGSYVLYEQISNTGQEGSTQPTPASHQENEAAPEIEPKISLSFAGDVMMSGNVEKTLQEKGYDYAFSHVSSLFLADDYTIVNLETPITERGTPSANKAFVYKSSPLAVPAMKHAGIDAVNLANNHTLDQGTEGLLDTLAALENHQIDYVGAGKDDARAYAPVYVEKNGIRVALLGFSRVIPEYSWYAGKKKPGLAATYDPALAVQAIQEAQAGADVVIVIAHWGKEKVDDPIEHQTTLARTFIDAGADLVIGGHPHVLQGFEKYQDKWIAYSLGNFIFTRAAEPKTWESMVLQAQCTKQGSCELTMLPYHAELGQAVPMNEADGRLLLERIQSLSDSVTIHPNGRLE
ncbi:CapA family protein [Brevibacillus nitrificans]|uniref:CapA family protein n=1 Tax=Brevibacillus nitrificans TaxID=651560 RepID=UPI0028672936|nr:CapA family protein [Brevibacillus nitrificans]MDR7317393.1 poly-gamma-glutamate synthesis protein (capsule biosynthesis protein) [Brevibacillus nitrificans]